MTQHRFGYNCNVCGKFFNAEEFYIKEYPAEHDEATNRSICSKCVRKRDEDLQDTPVNP